MLREMNFHIYASRVGVIRELIVNAHRDINLMSQLSEKQARGKEKGVQTDLLHSSRPPG